MTSPDSTSDAARGSAPVSSPADADTRLFVFESSHYALWAEDVARERSVDVKVVAAPAGETATCGLALQVPAHEVADLRTAFADEGIAFSER